MQGQPQKDTAPELALRRELHRRGLRYRTHFAVIDQRRKHDIVFRGPRIVVEVRGCFWHGCPIHGTDPKKNADWWATKLDENRRRDADTDRRLMSAGWSLVAVWEHEAAKDAADEIERLVRSSTCNGRAKPSNYY
jgi:DNA mismatch endonuclease (patch repair protein)